MSERFFLVMKVHTQDEGIPPGGIRTQVLGEFCVESDDSIRQLSECMRELVLAVQFEIVRRYGIFSPLESVAERELNDDLDRLLDFRVKARLMAKELEHWPPEQIEECERVYLAQYAREAALELGISLVSLEDMDTDLNKKDTQNPPVGKVSPETQTDSEIAKLEAETPSLDRENGNWVSNKTAAKIEGIQAETLADYRKVGIRNSERKLGRDHDGRVWRREGTPNSHPWYLKSSLVNEQAKSG